MTHVNVPMSPITVPLAAVCRDCGYPLRYLTQSRCPECGKGFDPHDPRTYRVQGRPRYWGWLARLAVPAVRLLMALCPAAILWALFPSVLYLIALPVIPLILIALRRWRTLAILVLFGPYSIFFASYAFNYVASGTDFVWDYSPPNYESENLDPLTRCSRPRSGGCGTGRHERMMRELPKPLVEQLMSAIVGPPRGAYAGPYPGKSIAIELARGAAQVSPSSFREGFVTLNGTKTEIAYELLRHFYDDNGLQIATVPSRTPATWPSTIEPPTAMLFQNHCLILRLPRGTERFAAVYLIDVKTSRAFAMYEDPQPLLPSSPAKDRSSHE